MKTVLRSKMLLCVAAAAGFAAAVVCWMDPPLYGDRREAVDRVETEMEAFVNNVAQVKAQTLDGEVVYLGPTREQWLRMQRVFDTLSYPNVELARAKTLLLLPDKPDQVSHGQWQDRASSARQEWAVWGTSDLIKTMMLMATMVFVGVWVAFVVVAWLWYFLLARVRELMAAARGEEM
jgi:hypothetical protein